VKVNKTPQIPGAQRDVLRELQDHATLLNFLTDGRIAGTNNASTAAPTGGSYAQGDFVKNSAPSEAGAAGSKYVVLGFVCVSGGTPGTWVNVRALTGN
jgi:hypothetical protein